MSFEKVHQYLLPFGYGDKILVFPESTGTVAQAAATLHTAPERIAKTLAFFVEETPVVVVVAGDRKIDNAKYRHTFGKKAKMISPSVPLLSTTACRCIWTSRSRNTAPSSPPAAAPTAP